MFIIYCNFQNICWIRNGLSTNMRPKLNIPYFAGDFLHEWLSSVNICRLKCLGFELVFLMILPYDFQFAPFNSGQKLG